ncbi:hypothetical protein BLS_003191 [Venturia inaequalis]|uniref:BTB domain-containing protein n=1 Tax=Venturia inaequalis TaxID=5025 RepID=A0A8H3Z3Z1_VENIN|nr:hypothetical protein BLS_003191 [Venturia inaequalis]KAE9984459.1 hypothetical protein EG328_008758 [Venturia inaequalis]
MRKIFLTELLSTTAPTTNIPPSNLDLALDMALEENQEQLLASISGLQNNDEYADITITCKGTTIRAHKTIICPQSPFFRNACKKDSFKEGETGIIDLPEDEPLAVKALLEFLYTADYEASNDNILVHAQTYMIAKKYCLVALAVLALQSLECAAAWISRSEVASFAAAVRWIYENTEESDQARKIVILAAVQSLDYLLTHKESEFSIMMVSLGEFGRDLARAVRYCVEFRPRSQHFHAKPSTSKDNPQEVDNDDDVSESETSLKAASLTTYLCKYCSSLWKIDTDQVQDFSEKTELICMHCQCSGAVLEKWNDESCVLLYEMECADCKMRFLCSDDDQSYKWMCFSCGIEGSFQRPENL